MSMPVGSVHVDVVPSTRDFVREMRKELLDEADKVGKEMGKRIGREVVDSVVKPISDGIEKGVERAKPEKGAAKTGKQAGDAFSRAFEREVRSALSSLPNVNLDVETDDARRSIGELRRELQGLFDEDGNLRVDVANEQGLERIREIRTELRRLRDEDVNVDIEFDIDRAIESLGQLERQARDRGQRAGDAFGSAIRSAIDSAMRALPDLDVGVNVDDSGLQELQSLYAQLEGLRDLEIGVDIREDQAVEGMRAILDQLETIAQDVEVSVRVRDDATTSATALRAFLDRLFPPQQTIDYFVEFETAPAERQVGAFARQLQREIGGAIEALPDIHLDMDSTDAEFRVAAIRRELVELSNQRIGIDIDADQVFARLQEIRTRLEGVRELAGARNELNVDTNAAVAALRSLADAAEEVESSVGRGHQVLNRFQEIALITTLAFTPAAAAVLGLAAAGLAVVAPIAAIAAGLDGIKAAVAPLTDELADMRSAVSDAFERGLAPAVSATARLMPTLTTGLSGVAGSLSNVANEMLSVAAESGNLAQLNTVFDQMNRSVTGLGPPFGSLTDNIIEFADIGSAALITFGPLLDQVGAAWDRVIESFRQTGAGEAAVVGLLQVLTSLLTLVAPLVQLGSSMFAVLGPALAAAINGAAEAIFFLANAFDMLPGPIQAALAAALLLRIALGLTGRSVTDLVQSVAALGGRAGMSLSAPFRDGAAAAQVFRASLDESGRSTAGWSQAVQAAGARVTGSLDNVANAMRTRIPQAAETAGRALTGGLANAAAAAGRAFDRLPDQANRAFEAVRNAPRAALTAVNDFADETGRKLDRWGATADNGIRRAEAAFRRVGDAPRAALNAVNSFADQTGARLDQWGAAVDGGIRRGEAAFLRIRDVPATAVASINSFADSTGAALTRWGAAVDSGIRQGEAVFRNLPAIVGGAVDDTVIAAARLTQGFDDAMRQLPAVVGNAGRAVSTAVGDMARSVETNLRNVPTVFRAAGTAIGNALSTIPTVISRAGQTIESGLFRMVTAAESAGRAMSAGMLRATSGLLDALGGPWGLAITAAVAALSLFGAAQADAAAKSAEFKTEVESTAQAMREAGGAITSHMREAEVLNLVQAGLSESSRTLGMNLSELANTAISGGAGWQQLRTSLEETVRAGTDMELMAAELGGTLSAQSNSTIAAGQAAQQLLGALDPLALKFQQAADENRIFQEMIRQSGNSMVGGIAGAAQLTEAFATLSDEMSTVADKAEALAQAMQLLTGGSLPAEQALAQMRNTISDVSKAFDEAALAAQKAGLNIQDSSGNINQATQAGRDLVLGLDEVGTSALNAAAAVFEHSGGVRNLAAASAAARNVIAEQRNAIVQTAMAAGVGAKAANEYADEMGLIPDLVVTLLQMKGLPQVQQELLQLQGQIDLAALGTVIPIEVSPEARKILEQIGVDIVNLPEGKIGILVDDQTASQMEVILNAIKNQPATLRVQPDVSQVGPGADVARSQVQGTPGVLPIQPDVSQVGPGADVARSQVQGTPGVLPIQPDGTQVPPAADALRGQVAGTAAQLPITPVDQVGPLLAQLRTDAATPISITINANDQATVAITQIKASAAVVVAIPVTANDVGAVGLFNSLRSNAAQVVAIPVTARDDGARGVIDGLRNGAAASVTMPIDADDSEARGVIDGLAEDAGRAVMMPIDADDNEARGVLAALANDIKGTRAEVVVDANTQDAEAAIKALERPTSSVHTVTIQVVGQLPRAMGGIVPADFSLFKNGGLHNGRLTPMRANYARVVQPNTYRVIGDRARDAEAYIPINQAPRSQQILKITAAQMGWGLHPLTAMASGGLLTDRRDLIATQSTGSFQSSVSSPVGGTVSARGVEQRLDQIAGLLAQNPRQPASITVEDRSGDPVQTARATQLALRLARH